MTDILLFLVLILTFYLTYRVACGMGEFIRRHPKAFPRNRRILRPWPLLRRPPRDDKPSHLCYNDPTNCKEPSSHEITDP